MNVGQYVAGGAPIVSLQALRPVYVNLTVPQQELARLRPGTSLEVVSDALAAPETGKIAAIDSVIDEDDAQRARAGDLRQPLRQPAPRHVRRGAARPRRQRVVQVVIVPASAISYAPFGDSVFIVEEMKGPDGKSYKGVRQQFVKLAGSRGDQVGGRHRPQARRRGRDLGRIQAPPRRGGDREQQSAAVEQRGAETGEQLEASDER